MSELHKITLIFPSKPDQHMLLAHYGAPDLIKGLVLRGTLRSNSPNLPRTVALGYDVEYGHGEMLVSDAMTGEQVVRCDF